MQCTSIKSGQECMFMTKAGCGYKGGICHQVVEECEGCARKFENASGVFCMVYPEPAVKWRNNGICNMATHRKVEVSKTEQKVNPLKASKRKMGK